MTPVRDEAVREFQRGPEERIRGIPRGPHEELRISLSEYEGWPFVDLRIWVRSPESGWRPTPRGTSVRLKEIQGVIEALRKVLVMVTYDPAPEPAPSPAPAPKVQSTLPGIKPPWDDDEPGIGQRRSRRVKT